MASNRQTHHGRVTLMINGTCYFASQRDASKYYGYKGGQRALKEGRIKIGHPPLKAGERAWLNDEGRWMVKS